MNSEYESSTQIVDNLYAFLGWVVSYSDYGKEIAVDTMLRKFKLLDRIDEETVFNSKEEYEEYELIVKADIDKLVGNVNINYLTVDEKNRCAELAGQFTPRYKRAKQFTREQIAEYKARKILNKQTKDINKENTQPVKLMDHETMMIGCVFSSVEDASKALSANKNKVKEAVEKNDFYKGYIWGYCDTSLYQKYSENLTSFDKCRKKSKKYCKKPSK